MKEQMERDKLRMMEACRRQQAHKAWVYKQAREARMQERMEDLEKVPCLDATPQFPTRSLVSGEGEGRQGTIRGRGQGRVALPRLQRPGTGLGRRQARHPGGKVADREPPRLRRDDDSPDKGLPSREPRRSYPS